MCNVDLTIIVAMIDMIVSDPQAGGGAITTGGVDYCTENYFYILFFYFLYK